MEDPSTFEEGQPTSLGVSTQNMPDDLDRLRLRRSVCGRCKQTKFGKR